MIPEESYNYLFQQRKVISIPFFHISQLPEQWKKFFYNWQPQIWYVLQQFAWIRRTEQKPKQIAFEFQLTTPLTADLKLKTPDAEVVRTNLFLPIRIERLPQSLKDMGNYYYGKKINQWCSKSINITISHKKWVLLSHGSSRTRMRRERRSREEWGRRTKRRERDKKRIALFSSLRPNLSSFILLIYMILLFQSPRVVPFVNSDERRATAGGLCHVSFLLSWKF